MERILGELSEKVGDAAGSIAADHEILVQLNVIFAKAKLAYKMKATRPAVTTDGHLKFKGARHPLIHPDKVVPIDVELGGDFDTLVITGPNTGGKTVTLKTVGLLTLMTMCGLLPPMRDGSQVAIFPKLLVDIGDEQSIEQSLSTFSAHMTNLIRILELADGQSLILMDEVGAGTDPVEGAALAVAVIERLRAKNSRVIATTHYAELKAYAIETAGVENAGCEFDVSSLRPTYRLIIGTPGRSNAFAIAGKLGMDPLLVQNAKDRISAGERQLESVIAALDEKRIQLELELKEAKAETAALKETANKTEARLQELESKRVAALEEAKRQAARLLEKARAEAEDLEQELKEIRKLKRQGGDLDEAGRRLKGRIKNLDDRLDPVIAAPHEHYVLPRPLQVGDTVKLADIDKEAVVTALPENENWAEVQLGVIRTRTPLSNLRLSEKKPQQNKKPAPKRNGAAGGLSSRMERSAETDLDLRGMNAEEAILEVDRFIDNGVLAGLSRLTIIHGKGTGVLRTAVQQHLKRHPSVKGYRLGTFGEGEAGVTVVELK
jgi:DNA mismatch repair protein MutS2